ncbi:MAG: hypothetical protein IJH94_03105 [Clostridia bacterium]|nr:hypothetical protein [Clostridia bacterium]
MNKNIIRIAEHYGWDAQAVQTMEECAELIQALSKSARANTADDIADAAEHIKEEIADLEIMVEQIKYMLNMSDADIDEIKEQKIARQIERINRETET